MQERREDRSLGDLFADLSRQTSTLIRQEIELAKTEMTAKASRLGRDVASLGAGAAVGYAGFLAIVYGVIVLLATVLGSVWLSAFIVGAVLAAVGFFLVQSGRQAMQREELTPQRTIESLKEDAEWAKDRTP